MPILSLSHLESMHCCYLLPVPRKEGWGHTLHHHAKIFQKATDLGETRILLHQRKLIMPLLLMQ